MASERAAPAPTDGGYQILTVAEVLADLASLNREQLLLVKSLEEAGDRRPVILRRVDDLLVVQEAADHVRATAAPTGPTGPTGPTAPDKEVSPDLLDQMGGLLVRNDVRKSSDFRAAWPLPDVDQSAPTTTEPVAPPLPSVAKPTKPTKPATSTKPAKPTKPTKPAKAGKAEGKVRPAPPNGHIVPTDGRRSRRGRTGRSRKILVGLLVTALLGGGGYAFWKHSQHPSPTAAATLPVGDFLATQLVKAVPAGFSQQPDAVGATGPTDLTKAIRDDVLPDAKAVLTQAGFLHGYQRLWSSGDNQQKVTVVLYHFRTAIGASAYSQWVVATAKAGPKPAPAGFAVASVPGVVGLSLSHGSAHSAEAIFTRGIYAVKVIAQGPVATSLVPIAQQVAAAQYAVLPG